MINTDKPDYVIYQSDEDGMGEKAILVKKYSDCFELTCAEVGFLVNYETIPDLKKVLNMLEKNPKVDK